MPAVLEIHLEVQQYPLSCHLNSQGLTKAKKVSAPLNKAVRENLSGKSTNHVHRLGIESQDSTSSDHEIDSMAPGFLEEQEEDGTYFSDHYSNNSESSNAQDVNPFLGDQLREMLQAIFNSCTNLEKMLLGDVTAALDMAKEKSWFLAENEEQRRSLRRFVMSNLRCIGYDAGICNSRWEKTNRHPAGNYEFIDVVIEGSRSMAKGDHRLFVDIDFRAQFEIARPTDEYCELVEVLPILFVGRAEKLRQVIRIVCDAARRSLKTKGMHIPPWRKAGYMQAKWLGSHRRTINPTSTSDLDGENAAMAALNSMGLGMGWDASFNHQMHLHFQQAIREANKPGLQKLKPQAEE